MDDKSKLQENTTTKKEKEKYGFRLKPVIIDMIDSHLNAANVRFRSDFVERAVKYYSLALDNHSESEVLNAELASLLKGIIEKSENRISKSLSKLVFNHSLTNRILSQALLNIDESKIKQWQALAIKDSRQLYGFVDFQKAMDERFDYHDEYGIEVSGGDE